METLIFNTALIRRRIRDPKLAMEILTAGESSHTDIAICYMNGRVDTDLLNTIKKRIQNLHVDALTMNQESLAECIYPHKWYNPFPKFRFFRAAGHGGRLHSGGKYCDPGGQLPLRHDPPLLGL